MWNTYHLMNNRARAVCYAARHQQFRALSEMTVNRLMRTANEQLHTMDMLRVRLAYLALLPPAVSPLLTVLSYFSVGWSNKT